MVQQASRHGAPKGSWLAQMLARKPKMLVTVALLPSLRQNEEIWAAAGHPIAPDKLALAVGRAGSTFSDHGMRWDNSGKNGHYAPISWSNQ